MPPGTTCSPTSKDTTIVSGFIPLSGISPPNRQSAKPLNPMSTKSGEGHKLSEAQKAANTTRSKVRARVEHVFGDQKNAMRAELVRTIGIVRARCKIGM